MIFSIPVDEVVANIPFKSKHLKILSTPKAMDILSKGLYSRPIEAMAREIATNAYDAHVINKVSDEPFEVTLPTMSNSIFSIRDYGPGIEESQIRDIFATYFASSKTEDNSLVGCLGLGSKSPLAVASQFTVESWKDGYRCLWTIYKDGSGFPSMSDEPLIKEKTDGRTGIKISVPIDHSKISELKRVVYDIYRYFKTIPKIINGEQVSPISKTSSFPSCWFEEGKGIYALMGNVLYPINTDISQLSSYKVFAQDKKLVIPFEIGELEFDASRESLTYNSEVIGVLKIRYNKIIEEFSKTIQEKINTATCAYDAVLKFNNSVKDMSSALVNAIYPKMIFGGKELRSYFPDRTKSNWSKDFVIKDTKQNSEIYEITPHSYRKRKFIPTNWVTISYKTQIFYHDNNDGQAIIKLCKFGESNREAKIFLINKGIDTDKWCELNFYPKDRLIPLSSLPKIEGVSRKSGSRKRAGVFAIHGGSVKTYFWKKTETPESGYYFVKSDDDILIGEKKINISYYYKYLKDLGILPTPLYGISKSHLKDYKNDPVFIPAEVYIISKLERLAPEMAIAQANSGLDKSFGIFWPEEGKLYPIFKTVEKNRDLLRRYQDICSVFGVKIESNNNVKIDKDKLLQQYPMLKPVLNYPHAVSATESKDYIRSVAKLKGLEY